MNISPLKCVILSVFFFLNGSILLAQSLEESVIPKVLNSVEDLINNGEMARAEELLSPVIDEIKSESIDLPSLLKYRLWEKWSQVTFDWYYYEMEEFRHEENFLAAEELVSISHNLKPEDPYRYASAWLELLQKAIRAGDSIRIQKGLTKLDSLEATFETGTTSIKGEKAELIRQKMLNIKQMHFYTQNAFAEADQFGKEAIQILEDWEGPITFDWVITYLYHGRVYYSQEKFQEAIPYFQKAIQFAESLYGRNYGGLGYINDLLAYCYYMNQEILKGIEVEESAIAITLKHYEKYDPPLEFMYELLAGLNYEADNYPRAIELEEEYFILARKKYGERAPFLQQKYNHLADNYIAIEKPRKAAETLQLAAEISLEQDGELSTGLAGLYFRIGDAYAVNNEFNVALEFFERSMNIYQSYGESMAYELAYAYKKMGAALTRVARHDDAIVYLRRAILTYLTDQKQKKWTYNTDLASAYRELAQAYRLLEQSDSSFHYINKALENVHPSDNGWKYYLYSELGNTHNQEGNYELALQAFQKSLRSLEKDDPARKKQSSFCSMYRNIGQANQYLGNYAKAISFLEKSLALSNPENPDSYEWMKTTRALAETYLALGDLDKALATHETVYQRYASQIENYQEYDNRASDLFMHFLSEFAGATFKKYLESKNQQDLIKAYQHSQQCVDIMLYVRQHLPAEQARESWVHKHNNMFELNIALAHELYQISGSIADADKALQTIEMTKSYNLLSALRGKKAGKYARVPLDLLTEEENLKYEILELKNSRSDWQKDQASSATFDSLLFETQRKYEVFLARLEEEYSTYFYLKYRPNPTNIDDIQEEIIKDGETMIQFSLIQKPSSFTHLPDSVQFILYTLTISPSEVMFQHTPLGSSFNDQLKTYLDIISSYRPSEMLVENLGSSMYDILIKKSLANLQSQPEKLVIIPDGLLNYLPFEVLPISDSSSEKGWLINRFTCSYAYSATLLKEQLRMRVKNPRHFFASFSADYGQPEILEGQLAADSRPKEIVRNKLYPLPNAEKEAKDIAELMGGRSFLKINATEKSFKENAPDYQILHLALHTFFDDEDPLQSDLVFTPIQESNEDGFLTAIEIYNLNLNAELAVLSACNTGFGKFQPGEGVKSLSRAMSYVGVPSTVMSLWKVPDKSTSQIMLSFYQYIKKGFPKDEALRKAKLDYLNNVVEEDQKSPLHWGGFVATGNMKPIGLPNQWDWVWMTLLAILILVGVVSLYQRFLQKY